MLSRRHRSRLRQNGRHLARWLGLWCNPSPTSVHNQRGLAVRCGLHLASRLGRSLLVRRRMERSCLRLGLSCTLRCHRRPLAPGQPRDGARPACGPLATLSCPPFSRSPLARRTLGPFAIHRILATIRPTVGPSFVIVTTLAKRTALAVAIAFPTPLAVMMIRLAESLVVALAERTHARAIHAPLAGSHILGKAEASPSPFVALGPLPKPLFAGKRALAVLLVRHAPLPNTLVLHIAFSSEWCSTLA
mmetsp:Transcript_20048/g.44514  ORF Transcript_20048/g.44514 Transcript_20048/m.44514 type:complete len:247 (-) Transcript_20048:172-912(-)